MDHSDPEHFFVDLRQARKREATRAALTAFLAEIISFSLETL